MRDQGIPLPSDSKGAGGLKKVDTVVLKAEMNGGANVEEGEGGKPQ